MKFKIDNFKPIDSAEIEIKDLTLIFGDNNNGKTYFSYALYGFLKIIKTGSFGSVLTNKIQNELLESGRATIKKRDINIQKIIDRIARDYADSMKSFVFSCDNNDISQIPSIKVSDLVLLTIDTKEEIKIGSSKITIESNKDIFEILVSNTDNIDHMFFYEIDQILLRLLFDIPNVFISVAERLGISLFQKDLDLNINTLVDHIKKNKEINPFDLISDYSSRYSLPVKDNIDFMRAIENIQKYKSNIDVDLHTHIKNMMDGEFKYDGTEIRFYKSRGKNKFTIPLHLASASVRALANLYFFLKHKAKKGDLIIIDEPESHLSLLKQKSLAKLIADCINNGLKILLTTHSDTLVLELNNLIMLNSDFDNKDNFINKHKYKENYIINPDCVSAYIAKNGTMSECRIDKYGIEVESMDKAINEINNINDELLAII